MWSLMKFILGWGKKNQEGNVLFNDTLNTFYLRLYGVRHMIKDHLDSESENLLLPHGLLFPMHHPHRQDNTYHGLLQQSWGTGWNEK